MIYRIYNCINESMIDDVIKFMGVNINCTIDNSEFCRKDLPVLKKNFDHIIDMGLSDEDKKSGITKRSLTLRYGSYSWDSKKNIATYTLNFAIKNKKDSIFVMKVNINDSKIVGYSSKFEEIKSST